MKKLNCFVLRYFDERFGEVKTLLQEILRKEGKFMADATQMLSDIKAAQAATQTALDNIVADEAAQSAKIQELIDQINNGTNVTIAQLQEVLDGSNAIKAKAEAIDTSIPTATPPGP